MPNEASRPTRIRKQEALAQLQDLTRMYSADRANPRASPTVWNFKRDAFKKVALKTVVLWTSVVAFAAISAVASPIGVVTAIAIGAQILAATATAIVSGYTDRAISRANLWAIGKRRDTLPLDLAIERRLRTSEALDAQVRTVKFEKDPASAARQLFAIATVLSTFRAGENAAGTTTAPAEPAPKPVNPVLQGIRKLTDSLGASFYFLAAITGAFASAALGFGAAGFQLVTVPALLTIYGAGVVASNIAIRRDIVLYRRDTQRRVEAAQAAVDEFDCRAQELSGEIGDIAAQLQMRATQGRSSGLDRSLDRRPDSRLGRPIEYGDLGEFGDLTLPGALN